MFLEVSKVEFTKHKIFQSDGGSEFPYSEFLKHLESCDILHQFSCPNTPEQNGIVERKHLQYSKPDSLFFHAHVPHYLWVAAFATSVLFYK